MNAVTISDPYPIPFTDESIDYSGDTRITSTLSTERRYSEGKSFENVGDKPVFASQDFFILYSSMLFVSKSSRDSFSSYGRPMNVIGAFSSFLLRLHCSVLVNARRT